MAAVLPRETPGRGWFATLRHLWRDVDRDNLLLVAAGCAFYAILALFPTITALVSIYGLVADPSQVEQRLSALGEILPEQASGLIAGQARRVAGGTGIALGWSAALSLLFALYTASSGVKTLFTALNIAYDRQDDRGFVRRNLVALAFTLAGVVVMALGLGVIVVLPAVYTYLPLGTLGGRVTPFLSWAMLFGLLGVGLAILYRFGPNRSRPPWRRVMPGTLLAVGLWGLGSLAFSTYVSRFASYNEVYGVLGGAIILLLWLYLSALAILLGAELNAERERAARG
ncbi:MAG: YihY/virulence factor BrkB family protein [Geminicoccaceae bacterium]